MATLLVVTAQAAARHVAQLVLTAEVTFDRDVSRAAFAIETEARVTAARAARGTVARAGGVATAAREAAAALLEVSSRSDATRRVSP
jgi:hypothetical protein